MLPVVQRKRTEDLLAIVDDFSMIIDNPRAKHKVPLERHVSTQTNVVITGSKSTISPIEAALVPARNRTI